jgi:hypothetical protein
MAITRLSGANAITGTLPATNINDTSIGNITALPAGVGGKVLQVVQGTKTDASTYSVATASLTSNIISVNITPSTISSKILIIANLGSVDCTTIQTNLVLNADGTNIFLGDSLGNRSRRSSIVYNHGENNNSGGSISATFLHSPSSNSQITYGVKLGHSSGTTQTIYVNRNQDDNDLAKVSQLASSLTLYEIAG